MFIQIPQGYQIVFSTGITFEVKWNPGSDSHNKRRHLGVYQECSPTAEVCAFRGTDPYGNRGYHLGPYQYCSPADVARYTLEASRLP